jgi:hypothetical protein
VIAFDDGLDRGKPSVATRILLPAQKDSTKGLAAYLRTERPYNHCSAFTARCRWRLLSSSCAGERSVLPARSYFCWTTRSRSGFDGGALASRHGKGGNLDSSRGRAGHLAAPLNQSGHAARVPCAGYLNRRDWAGGRFRHELATMTVQRRRRPRGPSYAICSSPSRPGWV